MAETPPRTEWPHWALPREDIFALGVIALNYNQLETMFLTLFRSVTDMKHDHVLALFQRLTNDTRQDILKNLMAQSDVPEKLADLVDHFLAGFKVLAANRHDLMHSHAAGSMGTGEGSSLVLGKRTKKGNQLYCRPTLPELQKIAEDMQTFSVFGVLVGDDINQLRRLRKEGDEERFWRFPLRDKPPLPEPLSWHAPTTVRGPNHPPPSSRP